MAKEFEGCKDYVKNSAYLCLNIKQIRRELYKSIYLT